MKKHIFFICLLFLTSSVLFSQPDLTFKLSEEINQSLENDSFIKTVIILKGQLDVLSLDQKLYQENASPEERAEKVIRSLKKNVKKSQLKILKYLESYSENDIKNIEPFWIINMIALEAKGEVLLNLLKFDSIAKMDIDGQLVLDATKKEKTISKTPGAAEPGLRVINAHRLWQLGYTGAGRIAMSIDTGVDGLHPALGWRWRGNHVPDSLAWFDPVYGTTFPNDADGRGTAIMGISCGMDSLTNDTIGVAFGAEWIASNSLWGSPHTSYTIAAMQWAMDPDGNPSTTNDMPDAITCAWWDPNVGFCDTTYANVFNAVEAAGIALIFSAGAGGPSSSSILMPANINTNEVNTWATGVIDGHTSGYPIYAPSGRGPSQCTTGIPSLDIKPEACAPGVNIRTSITNNAYHIYSGSSMATAHVTGAVAILKEAFPYLTGHEIKMALYNTALDLGTPGEDNIYGMGLIDIWAAYNYLAGLNNPTMTVAPTTINDTLLTGTTSMNNIKIFNNQTSPSVLNFTVSIDSMVNWLIIEPIGGSVVSLDSSDLLLSINTSNLIAGDYLTHLIITGNDTNNSIDSVTIILKVIDFNSVTCSDTLLEGNVAVGETDSTSFWIYNNSSANFYFDLFISPYPFENNENIFQSLKIDSNWTLQFAHPLFGTNSGVEFDGTYFYVTQSFSNFINQYDNTGNYIGQFSIPGVSGLRDLAFDGTYMYGGSAGNIIYEMDFYTQSLIGTINSPNQTVRHIAYDELNNAFWVGNWNTDIDLVDRTGTVLNTIPAITMGLQLQGSAYDNYSDGGPFLWVFDQGSGPGTPHYIRQIELSSGTLTGVQYNVTNDFPNSNGIGGGLFVTNDYIQNKITLGGILRDTTDILFGYDIGSDLPWVEIDPTTGIIPPIDSAEIKVYWFGPNSPSVIEGYISTPSNDPVNPIISLVHLVLNTVVSSINEDAQKIPNKYFLHQNYPNPFNPATTIGYDLKENALVNLSIFNILGEKIRTLVNTNVSSGFKSVEWDGLNDVGEQVSTGIYIYKLEVIDASITLRHRSGEHSASKYIQSRKMVFMK